MRRIRLQCGKLAVLVTAWAFFALPASAQVLFEQTPGQVISIDLQAMPAPYSAPSPSNSAQIVPVPAAAALQVPQGFVANIFAEGLSHARNLLVAPNGDVFLAEQNAGRVTLLRDGDGDGRAETRTTFVSGYNNPYGLALLNNYLYIADVQAVWRVPYTVGSTSPGGARQQLTAAGALGGSSGHSTRNLVVSPNGSKMYVAIGSQSNIAEETSPRATIQEFNTDGSGRRTFASGLRNPVGMGFYPGSGTLFAVVNERDGLHDELVPDYLTRVQDGGFYGWPYSYMGQNPQPNLTVQNQAQAQAMIAQAITPDLPLRSHSAPLGMTFYTGTRFPAAYQGGAFIALHGSWNAGQPRGYMVAFVPFANGISQGSYTVFASGFWVSGTARAQVFGRPAAVAVGADGSLLIADDVSQKVWRVAYAGTAGGQTVNAVVSAANAAEGWSFLRFHNAGSSPGTVTLTLRASATGAVLGTWTSPAIAPNASRQFAVTDIQAQATPNLSSTPHAAFSIDVGTTFNGFVQHALWRADIGTLENMSRCSGGPSADGATAVNVHSRMIPTYPSYLRVYNFGAATQTATLTFYDAASGAHLATWTSPAIPAGAAADVAVSTIETGSSPPLTSPSTSHYVVKLDTAFTGYLQHVVRNAASSVSEMTDKCDLTAG